MTGGEKPDSKFRDVSTWTWILGGKAIRTAHSVNDGAYMGETHIWFDEGEGKIRMLYVTTGGFYTEGTAWQDGDRIRFHEVVKGNAQGIRDVEAESWIDADGHMHVRSRMRSGEKWAPWSENIYKRQE